MSPNRYYPLPDPDWTKQDPDELRKKYYAAVNELTRHLHNIKRHREVYGEKQVISPFLIRDLNRLQYKIRQMQMTAHFWSIDLNVEGEE